MHRTLSDSTFAGRVTAAHPHNTARENEETQFASTLIKFPGGARNVPEWRKRLSQRVREVQEQKAREAAEAQAATRAAETVSCALPSGQLELVPDPEQAPLNPIVSKALERVDRARRSEFQSTTLRATKVAPELAATPSEISTSAAEIPQSPMTKPDIDSKPKLTIVAATATALAPAEVTIPVSHETPERPKQRRVISESVENAALSYLENCLGVPALASDTRHDTVGLGRRTIVGIVDLILIALVVSPLAAAIQLNGNWSDSRTIGLMAAVSVAAMLAYFTISVALTGRTISMRLFSVRTIDARTGLIPTGGQSIKRALGYVFSLGLLGLGFAFAFIDREQRTLHDRFSKTIVVRD